MALSDFEVVRQSGQATQADLQKAYEKSKRPLNPTFLIFSISR